MRDRCASRILHSPAAKQGVASLLHGATLASVSSEAESVRNSHPDTARWHYVNIPLTATAYGLSGIAGPPLGGRHFRLSSGR